MSETTTQFGSLAEINPKLTIPATGNPNPISVPETTNSSPSQERPIPTVTNPDLPTMKILPPNHNSPLISNRASQNPLLSVTPLGQTQTETEIPLLASTVPSTHQPAPILPLPQPSVTTLAEKLRAKGDTSLKRLAPISLSETGRPHVLIPDSVFFQKGAELHKDFIICYFNGRPPPFNQIQSVMNLLWGKCRRLEIHNNPLQRSAIVRIPSEYLRHKILDKNIWYVGDSMFHTVQWSSEHSTSTPPLSAIKIWAHLSGVPLDLRYQQGLSLVAGLIGDPKETDDFTLNLVSLTMSHVQVEVDLTKPLLTVVEFERQSGEVVEVKVDYPWLPPQCSHCHELGHVIRNCLKYTPPKDPPAPAVPASSSKVKDKGFETPKNLLQTPPRLNTMSQLKNPPLLLLLLPRPANQIPFPRVLLPINPFPLKPFLPPLKFLLTNHKSHH